MLVRLSTLKHIMSLLEILSKTQFFWLCISLYFVGQMLSSSPLRILACLLIGGQALIVNMKSNVLSMHPHCLRGHSEE